MRRNGWEGSCKMPNCLFFLQQNDMKIIALILLLDISRFRSLSLK